MALAKPSFDGGWSVLIVTEKGTCDRAYRYPVKIENGSVGYAGYRLLQRFRQGRRQRRRDRHGLPRQPERHRHRPHVRADGAGTWTAASGECSGTWTAERRLLSFFCDCLSATSLQPPDLKPGARAGLFSWGRVSKARSTVVKADDRLSRRNRIARARNHETNPTFA